MNERWYFTVVIQYEAHSTLTRMHMFVRALHVCNNIVSHTNIVSQTLYTTCLYTPSQTSPPVSKQCNTIYTPLARVIDSYPAL